MTNNPEATDYPEAVWYTPSDNSSRKYIRDDLCKAALASSAPATGEREQIVAMVSGFEAKCDAGFERTRDHGVGCARAAFRKVLKAIARGNHRTQSGEMEGLQITREIEHNPYGKGWPDWMKGVTIGGYAEQGWAAFYEGRHIVSGEWGEYLKRSHLPTPDIGKAGPLTNQDGGEKL